MSSEKLDNQVEALIFSSASAITLMEIKQVISEIRKEEVTDLQLKACLKKIEEKYQTETLSIELVKLGGGFQFLTKKEYHPVIRQLHLQSSKKALSQAALETLAIIAYKQPVTKLEIEQIRGVNCDYSVQKLLDKELINISGRSTGVGKPILYSVSAMFLDYFGINSGTDLPDIKSIITDPQNNTAAEE